MAANAAVIASMDAQRSAEEDRKRRFSVRGIDQVLLRVKGRKDQVGKVVAETFDNWGYDGTNIIKKNASKFDFYDFVIMAPVAGLFILFLQLLLDMMFDYELPLTLEQGIGISIIVGILFGVLGVTNTVGWIRIEEDDGEVLVEIKKYNGSGYRNIDEIDLFKIIKNLKNAKLLVDEE